MENNFDIKKFLIENKLTRLSEQDDDWDLEAGEEWNIKDLGVGDYITLDMLNKDNQNDYDYFLHHYKPRTFPLLINKSNFKNYVMLKPINSKSEKVRRGRGWMINFINDRFLKPQYQIVPPLNESDNEWDFEAGPEWNTTELSDGDYITQDMWEDPYKGSFPRDTWQIMSIDEEWDDIALEGNARGYISWSISAIQDLLKSEYKIVENKNLYEQQDDDWDLEADEEWNIKDLSVGDYITPEMFNDSVFTKLERDEINDIKIVDFFHNSLGDGFVIEYIDSSGKIIQDNISVETFNKHFLKPGYQIVPPLNEQDDEWDFEAGEEWNVKDLTVGNTFTPEMFNKAALSHYKWVDGGIIKKYKTGNDHVGLHDWIQISYINDKGKRKYDWNLVYTLNKYFLKPEYQIIPPLNEQQDDDWDLEAGDEWNVKDLRIGDYITPEMFNDNAFTKSWKELNDIKIIGFRNDFLIIEYIGSSGKIQQDNIDVEIFNQYFLKPQYQIVPPLNEQQDDDDWDLEAGDEWNVTELGIGDHITLDMLNKDNQTHLEYFFRVFEPNTFPLLIDRKTKGYFGDSVTLKAINFEGDIQRGYSWMVKTMNNIVLKPEYQIVFP